MKFRATVTSKGQITIPIEVRRRLGLEQGDRVVFEITDDVTILRPLRADEENPFAAYAGALGSFTTREEVDAWLRDLRDDAPTR